jgi:hypothetical protein
VDEALAGHQERETQEERIWTFKPASM